MSRLLIGALLALATLGFAIVAAAAASGSHSAEIACAVVPPRAPVDCSLKAALRGAGVPLECNGT